MFSEAAASSSSSSLLAPVCDCHLFAAVREAVWFSARLRLPPSRARSKALCAAAVDRALRDCELDHVQARRRAPRSKQMILPLLFPFSLLLTSCLVSSCARCLVAAPRSLLFLAALLGLLADARPWLLLFSWFASFFCLPQFLSPLSVRRSTIASAARATAASPEASAGGSLLQRSS